MAASNQFFVDTNILIAHIRQQSPSILEQAISLHGVAIVSDIVVFELEVGARRASRKLEFSTNFPDVESLPLTQEILLEAAAIQAKLIAKKQRDWTDRYIHCSNCSTS
jgi:predicted nucleic acid-binding protein